MHRLYFPHPRKIVDYVLELGQHYGAFSGLHEEIPTSGGGLLSFDGKGDGGVWGLCGGSGGDENGGVEGVLNSHYFFKGI